MIDPQEVDDAIRAAMYEEDEVAPWAPNVPPGTVKVAGIMVKIGFHPERLEAQREKVRGWLEQLDPAFRESGAGGWSFLNMCLTADGEQWTGEHRVMEALMILGLGLGLMDYLLPRPRWNALPGGMPYVVFHDVSPDRPSEKTVTEG